jgi:2-dehydro-3-deoxy-D-arabinonate dehydratase
VGDGLYRLRQGASGVRLGVGPVDSGPSRLLPRHVTVADVLHDGSEGLSRTVASPDLEPLSTGSSVTILAPVDRQEVWAAGVTYRRSRDARKDESTMADVYDRVYVADRPELFFKSAGWRVSGPGEPVGIRVDSSWDVPEPELGVVVAGDGSIAGWVIGNDMSSRSIEGENPLYLPQAKVYERSCALGPCLVPRDAIGFPAGIRLRIERDGATAFEGATSTDEIVRSLEDLVSALTRALSFPDGSILLTGTGVVPGSDFTLLPNDVVEIRIDGLGMLRNSVISVG